MNTAQPGQDRFNLPRNPLMNSRLPAPRAARGIPSPPSESATAPPARHMGKRGPTRRLGMWCIERKHPRLTDCVVARTRYIDEYLAARIAEGLDQLVILG